MPFVVVKKLDEAADYKDQMKVIPYLQTPTGCRILLARNFEDVWFDAALAWEQGGLRYIRKNVRVCIIGF